MISIVIPCHNEEESLKIFFRELTNTTKNMNTEFEYIFVNDGSSDNTLQVIKKLYLNEVYNVKYMSFSRNFGKEAAMYAGLKKSKGDYVVIMDADLQDPPELLIDMYVAISNKNIDIDCVVTRRENRRGEPVLRSLFSNMFYKIIGKLSSTPIISGVRDYRMMTRQMVDSILEMTEYNRFSKGIFSWVGFNTKYIPYKNRERVAGSTSWGFKNLFMYSIEGIINFSEKPLYLASIIGIITCLISSLSLIFVVIRAFIIGDPVQGWPSLVSIILFFSGLQLFCLGITGQYIGKIYLESKKRPHYIIKEESNEKDK